jgi:VCBS repeat-containing protein
VAVLPQVVGNIQMAIGSGTITDASGLAVQIKVGDPVCQGDAIETAADGRVGIRFIDGTMFNLFSSTRAVLNEFVCDSSDSSHSALFGVTRGTFAFVAGQMAKTGCLSIDTPLGNIRSRARGGGGMGMLSLTALTFSLMNEVQAGDPNATFLQYGKIKYTLLDHGVFELVTKEPIPRYILVEDPGETFVLTLKNSTISVDQVANSAARMAELQAAQRDVLANFAKGFSPVGSSTPAFGNPLTLQPINFIQTNDPAAPQNALAPLPAIFKSDDTITIIHPPPPPPPPPTLNAATGPTETDTVVFDSFTATSGTFVASSPRGDTLTYGISGGTAGSTVVDGVTYDVSKAGSYGTLYVDSATGAYIYVPDSGAINALTTTKAESFTVTVSDGTLSASQTFAITIEGVNDAAIISGTATGAVTEAGGVANATPGTPTATGTLTDTDVDNAPNTFTAVSSPKKSDAGFGTFTMTAAGVWTYTLDDANSAVQALNASDTLTDSFTVTTVDGTVQVVTITIQGAADAAIVSGTTAGTVAEAGGVANATPGTPTATGTLADADVDNPSNAFTAVSTQKTSDAGYGTFTMTAAGVWTYTLDNTNGAVQALNVNDTLTDTFTVTTVDGTTQVVTITINGTNDAAIVSGKTADTVIEAGDVANATPGTPTATGTLTDADVDNTPNTFTAVTSPKASAGGYGTFTMTAAGVWTYTLDDANSAVQALNTGNTLTDTFTVTTVDGTAQLITITINGSNDAAVISGAATGSVIEAGGVANATPGTPTATGTLTDADVDNTPNTFTAVTSPKASAGGYGSFTMTAAGVWTYTLNDANGRVQALNVGNTLTDTFTVTTVDGTAQVITITINGSNDAAVISGAATGPVIEAGGVVNATPGKPTATGTLTDADVDNSPNTFTAVSSPTASAGGYGTFTMTTAGVWTYTLNDANGTVQALNVGSTLTDSFTVTTVDGTAQVVTITITGSNDAAIISGTSAGSVIEAGGAPGTPIATGTLTDTDVDNAPNTFTAVGSPAESDGGYGIFTMTAAGVWTYTLDNANSVVQALDVGDTLTDTFTVTSIDGTAQVVTITIHGASDADPNDFDNLATGTHVISDPPFVYGTPGHDSIAGGGDVSQTVYGGAGDDTLNGTGVNDIIYGGSGNDTIKGNNGDDTIYGGSGNDTINSSNGNDAIIGGFGADSLTGGNGDDRFVYLSVADSHPGHFDTITDFESGSDKIDLTAFGALAFLALSSTSTVVPPHTVAWLYDSASNETIVYVNSTGEALDIGDSALVEIHLQGIATIQQADFVPEPTAAPVVLAAESIDLALAATAGDGTVVTTTTADVWSDSTGSDSARIADASWSLLTADEGFSFHFARDRVDSIGHGRFAGFGDAPTRSTEDTDGDAVITLANGPSVEPHRGHDAAPMEDHFTLDQKPAHDNAGATTIGNGTVMPPSGTVHNTDIVAPHAPAEQQHVEHGAAPEGGGGNGRSHSDSNNVSETGSIDTPGNKAHSESSSTNAGSEGGGGNGRSHNNSNDAFETSAIDTPGNKAHSESSSTNAGSEGGGGNGRSHNNSNDAFETSAIDTPGNKAHSESSTTNAGSVRAADAHADHSDAAGNPGPPDSFHFKAEVVGSGHSDVVDLTDVGHPSASNGHPENTAASHGGPAISETQTTELSPPGPHFADHSDIVPDHVANAAVAHVPHDLMV